MREDGTEIGAASDDPYAWSSPHADASHAEDADPYVWRDGSNPAAQAARSEPGPSLTEASRAEAAEAPAAKAEGEEIYAWVEEPAPTEAKPRRRSRGRGRSRGDAVADTPVDVGASAASDGSLDPGAIAAAGVDSGAADLTELSVDAAAAALGVTDPAVAAGTPIEDATGAAEELAPTPPDGPVGTDEVGSGPAERGPGPLEVAAEAEPASAFEAANESAPPSGAAERLAETVDSALGVAPDENGATERTEPAPRAPDPAEVSGPPAAPRRGWWRLRG